MGGSLRLAPINTPQIATAQSVISDLKVTWGGLKNHQMIMTHYTPLSKASISTCPNLAQNFTSDNHMVGQMSSDCMHTQWAQQEQEMTKVAVGVPFS